ncbi:uncharacterized protein LOC112462061 [Temnothorax curvispinosus]|uniref:Uncharacterized protein LOC112462061 n=1 Tax=Temnothorax curvispinosus TaxID=300111 RepID=A0A6J1QS12_9HYME|nr:uncharacterized protein LOC112462061 [Temnothorax curvispinosus]
MLRSKKSLIVPTIRLPTNNGPTSRIWPTSYQLQKFRNQERRIQFCEWYVQQVKKDDLFPSRILWTDKAIFTRYDVVKVQSNYVWVSPYEDPRAVLEKCSQRDFSCNVWMGIYNDMLIGPYFLPEHLTARSFLNFLSNDLTIALEDVPLLSRQHMWIQLNGFSAYSGKQVQQWLNEHYPKRWIGRESPISWPPKSQDLTPLDFYLWSTMKKKVYRTKVKSRDELMQRIINAAEEIKQNRQEILEMTNSILKRCTACIDVGGRYNQM